MNLEWVVMHLPGLLIISLIIIKQLNFIIPILHGDWLEVVYLKVSALGPLLFLVYVAKINDMPSQVKNGQLLQYADDVLYYAKVQIRGMFISYYLRILYI